MIDEVGLAWALAHVAEAYLSTAEAHELYIAIGVGETFAAISLLIAVAAREDVALHRDLVCALTTWLNAYTGSEDEPRLRRLVGRISAQPPHPPPR